MSHHTPSIRDTRGPPPSAWDTVQEQTKGNTNLQWLWEATWGLLRTVLGLSWISEVSENALNYPNKRGYNSQLPPLGSNCTFTADWSGLLQAQKWTVYLKRLLHTEHSAGLVWEHRKSSYIRAWKCFGFFDEQKLLICDGLFGLAELQTLLERIVLSLHSETPFPLKLNHCNLEVGHTVDLWHSRTLHS